MIIPTKVTDYCRSQSELLQFAIFAACVAGKNSDQVAKKVNALWRDGLFRNVLTTQFMYPPKTDTEYALYLTLIRRSLEEHKIGQYDRLSRVIFLLNQFSVMLDKVLWQDLVGYKGIGPKTAAFFLLHSRVIFDIPVIDTHVVKYMATKGVEMKVTSNITKYLENAKLVRHWYQVDFPNMTMAEADLHVWTMFSGRLDNQPNLI